MHVFNIRQTFNISPIFFVINGWKCCPKKKLKNIKAENSNIELFFYIKGFLKTFVVLFHSLNLKKLLSNEKNRYYVKKESPALKIVSTIFLTFFYFTKRKPFKIMKVFYFMSEASFVTKILLFLYFWFLFSNLFRCKTYIRIMGWFPWPFKSQNGII